MTIQQGIISFFVSTLKSHYWKDIKNNVLYYRIKLNILKNRGCHSTVTPLDVSISHIYQKKPGVTFSRLSEPVSDRFYKHK